ncbi:hypothetical protein [Neptunomonas phycophila]|uniref:hypothetical protein n=1 Tax=Neptunomonas phycophila TaxID=1572645 RepID=UPI0015C0C761|nr:hypothetical protein [Neptunomonas phycophila]QLE96970.1 hypothetical protein FLM49_04645 [Neptunomonas phycophila]
MSLHRAEITPVIEGRNGNNFTRIKISKDKAKLTAKPPGLMLLVSGVMLVGPTIMLGIMIPMFYKDFGWPPALAMSFMLAVFFLVNYALWTSVKCVVFDRAKKSYVIRAVIPFISFGGARYSLQGCTGLQLLEERDFSVRRSDAAGVEVNPVSSYEINLVFDDRRENIVQVKDKGQAEKIVMELSKFLRVGSKFVRSPEPEKPYRQTTDAYKAASEPTQGALKHKGSETLREPCEVDRETNRVGASGSQSSNVGLVVDGEQLLVKKYDFVQRHYKWAALIPVYQIWDKDYPNAALLSALLLYGLWKLNAHVYTIIVDKGKNLVFTRPFFPLGASRAPQINGNIRDIKQVEFYDRLVNKTSKNKKNGRVRHYQVVEFEVNFILRSGDKLRIIRSDDRFKSLQQAQELAAFMDKPLENAERFYEWGEAPKDNEPLAS